MQQRQHHGEAASAQLGDDAIQRIQEIREEAKNYTADCVYNMDETGKYWKLKPDRSLTTLKEHGRKKDKTRITACLACNATGTDKLPIWFIGKAKRPNCFRAERLEGLERLGAVWRHNDTAWMNYLIMIEYLLWFDQRMKRQRKHVLLIMDNFSAHELAVELLDIALENTKVRWLPLNTTSVHPPALRSRDHSKLEGSLPASICSIYGKDIR
jgi:hypothetical protein